MAKITAAVQGETTAVQSLTFAVDNVPVYKSKATYTAHVGTAFSYPITTVYGYPVPTITTTSSLPGGVHLVDNGNGTGALTGTPGPMTGGIYTITVASTNGIGPRSTRRSPSSSTRRRPLPARTMTPSPRGWP